MEKKKVIMCDMDGTLTCSNWRNKWAPGNGGNWAQFHARCGEDKPTALVGFITNSPFDVIISTARPESVSGITSEWLEDRGICPIAICTRSNGEKGIKSTELKKIHINIIREKGYEIILFIDDRKDVCAMAESMGVPSMLVNFEEVGVKSTWNHDPKTAISFPPEPVPVVEKTPNEVLKDAADFFESRDPEYGSAWKRHGAIMAANFPDGLTLKTKKDFFMYHCLVMDVVKTTRICNAMSDGKDHEDSWSDKMVYSAMAKSQIKD